MLFLSEYSAETIVLLTLHVEHPVGDVIDLFRWSRVAWLVGCGGVILALAPVAVVATAVEGHCWCRKLVVLVESHGLAPVSCSALGNVIVVSTTNHLVANGPRKAHTLRTHPLVKRLAIRIGHLGEVRLEGLAKGVQAALRMRRHGRCCTVVDCW